MWITDRGGRKRGKPKRRWVDDIAKFDRDWVERAADREDWRSIDGRPLLSSGPIWADDNDDEYIRLADLYLSIYLSIYLLRIKRFLTLEAMFILNVVWIPNWLLIIFSVICLIWIHYIRNFRFWKHQGVPGPSAWPIFGHFKTVLYSKPAHEVEYEFLKKYGNIYGKYEMGTKIITVNDPELLKLIFVKDFDVFRNRGNFGSTDELFTKTLIFSEDEEWKNSRKILSQVFSSGKIKQMSPLFSQCCDDLEEVLMKTAETGEIHNYKKVFSSFAVNVSGKCFFGIDVDGGDPNGKFNANARKMLDLGLSFRFLLLFLCPKLMNIFKIPLIDPTLTRYFSNVILQIMEARKGVKSNRMDFVQIAVDYMKDPNNKGNSMGNFTVHEIINHSLIFLFSGVDNIANILSIVVYNLALYPEWQEKIQQEVDRISEKRGCIDYEAVQEMPYLSAVIDETLRLYPGQVHGERVCSANYDLGSIFVPKGTVVRFTPYSMHRNPEFWPKPDEFDPERFLGENVKNHHPYAYLPFSHGPRNCIAKRFAEIEMKLCLARILKKCSFGKCPQTDVPLKFKPGYDTLMVHSVNLQHPYIQDIVPSSVVISVEDSAADNEDEY
ncbi:Cytochrome P450 3A1 [Nymphon striatum]|nr:Cytochrome P450 3A1 [Nymphon striatum]